MGVPATPTLYTFDGTGGPPMSSDWLPGYGGFLNRWERLSDEGVPDSVAGSGYAHDYWNTLYPADQEVWCRIVRRPSGDENTFGLYLRTVDITGTTPDAYALRYRRHTSATDEFEFLRIDDNVGTVIGATVTQNISDGDWILIRAIGTTFYIFIDTGSGWT